MNLVLGSDGLLGSHLMNILDNARGFNQAMFDLHWSPVGKLPKCSVAYLCAGTKGFAECEGGADIFRADVDGNIRAAKYLLKNGAFVVFVSTDGVEWGANLAYARNRLLVEMALVMQSNTAIVRAAKFDERTVGKVATLCKNVGEARAEGVHYWP